MTTRPASASTGPSGRGRLVVWLLLAVDLLVLVPLCLLLIWLAITSDNPDWDSFARILLAVHGVGGTVLFVAVGVAAVRYNILGLPPVRADAIGLRIGESRVTWTDIREVSAYSLYGVPYFMIDIDPAARERLSFEARITAWGTPRLPDGRRPLWITEEMLGTTVEEAVARIEPQLAKHAPSAESVGSVLQ